MFVKNVAVLVVAAAIYAGPVRAECEGNSTVEMRACASERLDKAEKALAEVYAHAASEMEGKWADVLSESQKAWLKYRESWCDISTFSSEGGSIRPIEIAACMEDMTLARTKELAELQ